MLVICIAQCTIHLLHLCHSHCSILLCIFAFISHNLIQYVCVCMYVCMYMYMYMYMRMYVCMYVCMHACIYLSIYLSIYIYIYIYIYTHIHTYIYIFIYLNNVLYRTKPPFHVLYTNRSRTVRTVSNVLYHLDPSEYYSYLWVLFICIRLVV
ncbi:hypothetical protein KP509_03G045800 [Ceratopteris richardii]|uniref:Uncharacterized protein n=1 Tax=Ceratopteris richardii TaxID=49495 RepID=A0A8T2V7A0_CERRI|nr:hypothetical protein KP509_03G045800 [Ceratopteris richardii]